MFNMFVSHLYRTWFLTLLKCFLFTDPPASLDTIVSDRQKGLLRAVADVFPEAHHGFCLRHMAANMLNTWKDKYLKELLFRAAKCFRRPEFDATMEKMKEHNEAAWKYVDNIPKTHWANVEYPGKRYGTLTLNASESVNNMLLKARFWPITRLIEQTRATTSVHFQRRRIEADGLPTPLTKYAQNHINQMRNQSAGTVRVQPLSLRQFEVTSLYHVVSIHSFSIRYDYNKVVSTNTRLLI